jgi:hypothetical protein
MAKVSVPLNSSLEAAAGAALSSPFSSAAAGACSAAASSFVFPPALPHPINKDAIIAHVKIEAIILFFILIIPPGFFFPFFPAGQTVFQEYQLAILSAISYLHFS